MVAGHLREKNNKWQVILVWKDPETGKRREKSVSTGLPIKGNQRKAERLLNQWRNEFEPPQPETKKQIEEAKDAGLRPAEKILFADYILEWCERQRTLVRKTTFGGYQRTVKNHIAPWFRERNVTLADLEQNPLIIQDFYTWEQKHKQIGANTVKHRHANISKCLKEAHGRLLIERNPAALVELPKMQKAEQDHFSQEELNALFVAFKDDPVLPAIMLAAFLGLTRSEVLGLKWSQVDFVNHTITVRHTVTETYVDGHCEVVAEDNTKTSTRRRSLPLVPDLEQMLLALREKQAENKRALGRGYYIKDAEYLLVNAEGYRLKPGYITEHYATFRDKYGFRKVTFHELRHSCATLLYAADVDIRTIQEWLGHSNIQTTMSVYAHFPFEKKIAAGEVMSGLLGSRQPVQKEKTSHPL